MLCILAMAIVSMILSVASLIPEGEPEVMVIGTIWVVGAILLYWMPNKSEEK